MKAAKVSSLHYVILALIFTLSGCGGSGSESSDETGTDTPDDQVENRAPISSAGADQSLPAGAVVTLNASASASSDADGDALIYRWALTSVPDGSTATLNNPNSVSPTFTSDLDGTYVAQLVVNDGSENSSPDTVNIVAITVQPPNNLEANFNSRELSLTWDSVPGADSHSVYFAIEPGVTTENYAAYDGGTWLRDVSSPLTIPQLQNNTGYFAVVTAFKSGSESNPSNEVAALVRDPNAVIAGRYKPINIQGDVILDTVNSLYWKRCSVGQDWSLKDLTCVGYYTEMNWYDAVETYGSWADLESLPDVYLTDLKLPLPEGEWRLPAIEQLATLLHCSTKRPQEFGPLTYCAGRDYQKPTIVKEAFPNSPTYDVWSGSSAGPTGDYVEDGDEVWLDLDSAWRAHFWSGGYTSNSRVSTNAMRLMRLVE